MWFDLEKSLEFATENERKNDQSLQLNSSLNQF